MNKDKDGLTPIQDFNRFKTCIFDAIDEWQKYYDNNPAYGLLVDPATLQVSIAERNGSGEGWNSFLAFLKDGEICADAVLDFADSFCFLR